MDPTDSPRRAHDEIDVSKPERAPLIADGVVVVRRPFSPTVLAVASAHTDAVTGETTEQWFLFGGAFANVSLDDWGTIDTGAWPNRLPFTTSDAPTDSSDLVVSMLAEAEPTPGAFFTAMKRHLAGGETQYPAGYAIARFTRGQVAAHKSEVGTDVGPVFLERMFKVGTLSAESRAHFCANQLVVQYPPAKGAWIRSRVHRAIWRADKFKFPPEQSGNSDAIMSEAAIDTPAKWWADRKVQLDPNGLKSAELWWTKFTTYEYRFTDWAMHNAPPNP
ncbi:MAG: hypothetical protein Q8P18_26460 [Pseudomonadota bacterium]|nr:hypothetical protein [Pseudomonadota bacterium]